MKSPSRREAEPQRPAVLIADPDPDSRLVVQAMLSARGFATVAAGQGDTALLLARSPAIGVVVTELYMETKRWSCLLEALRADPLTRSVRIIVHTVFQRPEDRAWAIAHRCAAWIGKPAGMERLVRAVIAVAERDPLPPAA